MNISTPQTKELKRLAALAVNPPAFAPDAPILDMPIPERPIVDGPEYRRKWDPARFSSFAEYEYTRKADQDALNDWALYCWLKTLPPKERAARWKYTLDMRAWQGDEGAAAGDMPLLEHYGL
jgi:hypothetical protein